jgi:hypothetical protein
MDPNTGRSRGSNYKKECRSGENVPEPRIVLDDIEVFDVVVETEDAARPDRTETEQQDSVKYPAHGGAGRPCLLWYR